jgi:hypothetical protein
VSHTDADRDPPDDRELERLLSRSLRASVAGVRPPSGLVTAGVADGARARRGRRVLAAAAAVVVAAGATFAAYRLPHEAGAPEAGHAGDPSAGPRCAVDDGVIPVWARTGFSEPRPRVPHVLGDRGRIVAIFFGPALYAPPDDEVSNKVLWVTAPSDEAAVPDDSSALVVDARLVGTDRTARRVLENGPGPSYLDLPAAGCWSLDLRWGSRDVDHDTMRLAYVAPPSAARP